MRHVVAGALLVGSMAWPASLFGQTAAGTSRGLASVSFGTQVSTAEIADSATFTQFIENGTFQARHDVGSGPLFDVGVAVALWKGLGAGMAVSRFTATDSAQVSIDVPHPFFFGQPRSFAGNADLSRRTLGVHLAAAYVVPTDGRIRVVLTGGPSVFNLSQEVVGDVQFQEAFPFDALVDASPTAQTESDTGVGFNLGVDVAVRMGPAWGVGFLMRYTHALVDLTVTGQRAGSRVISTDVGGLQVGGGLRLYFWEQR